MGLPSRRMWRTAEGDEVKKYAILFLSLTLLCVSQAQASMRCESGIISGGELIAEVLRKCGNPSSRQIIEPVIGANGKAPYKSATVEDWVYGPRNGLYQYLRFIDGKLASIRSDRG
jgi:hypothetical protein